MRILRHLFQRPVTASSKADARLDCVTFYTALSFMALIVLVTLPHRPF